MQRLAMVLLLHETPLGRHYDWLMEDGSAFPPGEVRLWAGRVALPSWQWAEAAGQWIRLQSLPAHRRRYLTFAGPLSDGRGWVRPVDSGYVIPRQWTGHKINLELHLRYFTGEVQLIRTGPRLWRVALPSRMISDKTG